MNPEETNELCKLLEQSKEISAACLLAFAQELGRLQKEQNLDREVILGALGCSSREMLNLLLEIMGAPGAVTLVEIWLAQIRQQHDLALSEHQPFSEACRN